MPNDKNSKSLVRRDDLLASKASCLKLPDRFKEKNQAVQNVSGLSNRYVFASQVRLTRWGLANRHDGASATSVRFIASHSVPNVTVLLTHKLHARVMHAAHTRDTFRPESTCRLSTPLCANSRHTLGACHSHNVSSMHESNLYLQSQRLSIKKD